MVTCFTISHTFWKPALVAFSFLEILRIRSTTEAMRQTQHSAQLMPPVLSEIHETLALNYFALALKE